MTTYATGAEFLVTPEKPSVVGRSDILRPLTPTVRGRSAGDLRSEVDIRHRTLTVALPREIGGDDTGPSPFEYVLGGFAGCLTAVVQLVAREQGVALRDVDVLVTGTIDPHGLRGLRQDHAGFQTITGRVRLSGDIDVHELSDLVTEVERRCPIHTLLTAAGVPPQLRWMVTPV
ncbi:OsmC family protein [Propionicicella superfundia]|uniref:OsmC family protein n=1 Tax=Propionicicella superfundia TaxID=348582 RepID=UPI0004047BCB|nr:OsmC family protein [Propionicicella superfundia]